MTLLEQLLAQQLELPMQAGPGTQVMVRPTVTPPTLTGGGGAMIRQPPQGR
jgi:hypothetical protein